FPLNGRPGEAFVGVLSGPNADASLMLDLYRTNGERLGDTVTASEAETDVPDAFALQGNYPNPFNPTTTIRFDLREAATVHVDIIDVLGRVVMTVPEQDYASGTNHALDIDAASLPSGMYLYRVVADMEAQTSVRTGRMMLVK
ncbi:MAG TPA: T9SS type A sorting domain-containing protein, partial [Rhodothermales bacterium]|nr:T9SS type A sorting domain-containing protein [Rhodothermales bacterium]